MVTVPERSDGGMIRLDEWSLWNDTNVIPKQARREKACEIMNFSAVDKLQFSRITL